MKGRPNGMSDPVISFVPLTTEYIPLMHQWLNQGEALRWYGGRPQSEAILRDKYLGSRPTSSCLVVCGDEPVGYLQFYRLIDHPDYCRVVDGQTGDYGVDLFIGSDDLLGQGLGTRILMTALRDLVFSRRDARRCLVGPNPENTRAIRCYAKCGFRHIKTVMTPDGAEYLMVKHRMDEAGGES